MKNYIFVFVAILMVSCGKQNASKIVATDSLAVKTIAPHREYNSIYHWKTTFNPTESELAFLQNQ